MDDLIDELFGQIRAPKTIEGKFVMPIFTPDETALMNRVKLLLEGRIITMARHDKVVIAGSAIPAIMDANNAGPESDTDYFVLLGDPNVPLNERLVTSPRDIPDVKKKIKMFVEEVVSANYMVKEFFNTLLSAPEVYSGYGNVYQVFNTMRGITKHQIIFSKFATRKELLDSFDFKHCTASYHKGKLIITRATFDAIQNRELHANNTSAIHKNRIEKYVNRGYKNCIPPGLIAI